VGVVSASYQFGERSRSRLVGVHPDLVLVVSRGLLYSPHDFVVNEGVRSLERQRKLVDAGMSKTLNSKHLVQPDGYAHAIDLVATGDLDDDGDLDAQDASLVWSQALYVVIADGMKRASRELGIPVRWGGDFRGFFDGPHFELGGI
jgi:peptidoglycan L-alanyl-D-glutamate endopeptidase CwlK